MISSTAARTSMKVINATSFKTSLQFLCCQCLRQLVPTHLSVGEVFRLPPGLRAFLDNNLLWLLRPVQSTDAPTVARRKRTRSEAGVDDAAASTSSSSVATATKWPRLHAVVADSSEDDDSDLEFK